MSRCARSAKAHRCRANCPPAKEQLVRIVKMLMGMLKRFSGRAEFLREDEGIYPDEYDQDHEHDHDYEHEQDS